MSSAQVKTSREKFGGKMSQGELQFFRDVRHLLDATIKGHVPFFAAMPTLLQDLREIRKTELDVDAALASGWRPAIVTAPRSPRSTSAPGTPSGAEREFLQDMDGLLDFAMRNGMSFVPVFSALTHDIGEVAAYGWDMDKAKRDFFTPKVTGWAKKNTATFGESETIPE